MTQEMKNRYVRDFLRLASPARSSDRIEPGSVFTNSDYEIVRAAVGNLPESEALVILLRFWKKFDLETIARALGLRTATVEKNLHSAFRALRSVCVKDSAFSRHSVSRQAA